MRRDREPNRSLEFGVVQKWTRRPFRVVFPPSAQEAMVSNMLLEGRVSNVGEHLRAEVNKPW